MDGVVVVCSAVLRCTELYAELAGGVLRFARHPASHRLIHISHTHRDRYLDAYGEAEVRGITERDIDSSTGESCPRLDVVYPGRALSACTWHCACIVSFSRQLCCFLMV